MSTPWGLCHTALRNTFILWPRTRALIKVIVTHELGCIIAKLVLGSPGAARTLHTRPAATRPGPVHRRSLHPHYSNLWNFPLLGVKVAAHEVIRLCHPYINKKSSDLALFKRQNVAFCWFVAVSFVFRSFSTVVAAASVVWFCSSVFFS